MQRIIKEKKAICHIDFIAFVMLQFLCWLMGTSMCFIAFYALCMSKIILYKKLTKRCFMELCQPTNLLFRIHVFIIFVIFTGFLCTLFFFLFSILFCFLPFLLHSNRSVVTCVSTSQVKLVSNLTYLPSQHPALHF